MLFYCRFTWYPRTSRKDVAERVVQQDAAGTNHPERIKDWYTLAGGGAGFLMIEAMTRPNRSARSFSRTWISWPGTSMRCPAPATRTPSRISRKRSSPDLIVRDSLGPKTRSPGPGVGPRVLRLRNSVRN